MKRRTLVLCLLISLAALSVYLFNRYWIHRFDPLIERQARVYGLDPDLVWSIVYEETYFRPWQIGDDDEIGLMQVTPTVGREWAAETGMRELEAAMRRDAQSILADPERNIQVGCWYLEKISKKYRDTPDPEARLVAAYNAGPSRALEWNRPRPGEPAALSANEFIQHIDIASTRAYVSSILARYGKLKERKPKQQQQQQQ